MANIDPWSSDTISDYTQLMEEFGISTFDPSVLPDPSPLLRRKVVFGQRGFDSIAHAISSKEPFCILTGLSPSGKMHLGHKMVIDEVMYYQGQGADVSIAVADIESYGVRGMPLDRAREIAINEYVVNYIALGLLPDKCQIYFQSKRSAVKDLGYLLGKRTNWSEMKAIYGFQGETNMAHAYAPLVQVGDIMHVQLEEYGGPRPTLVPVGIDQDPHLRLSRRLAMSFRYLNAMVAKDGRIGIFVKVDEDVDKLLDRAQDAMQAIGFNKFEKIPAYKALYVNDAGTGDLDAMDRALIPIEYEMGGYAFHSPASSYHRLMSGLTGGKMSSSQPDSAIFLSDEPKAAAKKIMRAKTGGAMTLEEQKENGGNPDDCAVYELFLYHLEDSDKELTDIYTACKAGERMCGVCKKAAAARIEEFLKELAEKRELAKEQVSDFVRED